MGIKILTLMDGPVMALIVDIDDNHLDHHHHDNDHDCHDLMVIGINMRIIMTIAMTHTMTVASADTGAPTVTGCVAPESHHMPPPWHLAVTSYTRRLGRCCASTPRRTALGSACAKYVSVREWL